MDQYRTAFMDAIAEFNSYGIAAVQVKFRITQNDAGLMYGFKADIIPEVLIISYKPETLNPPTPPT